MTDSAAWGQIPHFGIIVSARSYDGTNLCDNAPGACSGASWMSELGTYEFDLYSSPAFPTDSIRFALSWPAEWEFVELAVCNAFLDSGEPWVRGSPLWFSFPGCRNDGRPIMRIVLNCTVPGRFRVVILRAICVIMNGTRTPSTIIGSK